MRTAIVKSSGVVVKLDGRAGIQNQVTADDVKDPVDLAALLNGIIADLAEKTSRWRPRVIYRRDLVVDATGSTKYRVLHGFGGRVNYEVAYWVGGSAAPNLRVDPSTDANALVLTSTVAGTVTLRIEEAG